jgi:hypothetical protein
MPKRLTDTEKWKDPFFNELSANYKLAWLYLLDECNHAGIWKKSIKRLNFDCDANFTEEHILKTFGDRIIVLSEDKWFIPKFIYFQYGINFVTSKQKQVLSAIEILNTHNLLKEDDKGSITLSIPYTNPNHTLSIPLPNPITTLPEGFPNPYGNVNGNVNVNGNGNGNGLGNGTGNGLGNGNENELGTGVENSDDSEEAKQLTKNEKGIAETSLEAILHYGRPGQIAITAAIENINDLGGLEKCLTELRFDYMKAAQIHNTIFNKNWAGAFKHGNFDLNYYYELYYNDFKSLEI